MKNDWLSLMLFVMIGLVITIIGVSGLVITSYADSQEIKVEENLSFWVNEGHNIEYYNVPTVFEVTIQEHLNFADTVTVSEIIKNEKEMV